ncbi:hypothetical protein [Bifidobacterium animalis]|uniref:hypothetical protein n=2 Tax=Bifidobacterium animalis TaxID=28025 RepID=UPI00214A522E|nr:hypothetical protein [Bifidobacterium animalis]MCR1996014.1 hypothetical protein [Bifidobacterium animalis subsp. animalis]
MDSGTRVAFLEHYIACCYVNVQIEGGGYVGQVSMVNLAFHSAFPLSTALWWYPTSYALFLIFLPFLNAGMKQLAQRQHKQLAIICLVLWRFLGLIPKINFDLTDKSVFVFIYWYILLSYYRWHMKKISTRQCWIMLGIGAMTGAVWLLGTNLLFSLTGRMPQMQSFIFRHWRLPMMMMGFAIFLLVMRTEFHNRLINTLASSAFGIFLIHSYPPILLSWVHYNPLDKIYQGEFAFLHAMAVVLYVYVACLLLDLIRQALFRLTIDRRRGACFDRLYAWSVHRFGKRGEHLISVAGPSAGSKGDDSDLVD